MRFGPVTLGLLSLAIATLLACSADEPSSPSTGTLEIATATAGGLFDADGYTLQVDGGSPQPIGAAATLTVSDLTPGDHTLLLGGVADPCAVEGPNPRTVAVSAAQPGATTFQVTCRGPGSLAITTLTTGDSPDSGGYTVSLSGGPALQLGPDTTTVLISLPPATYHATLSDVAANCVVTDGADRTIDIVSGVRAAVQFTVRCTPPGWGLIELPSGFTAVNWWSGGKSLWGTGPSDLFVVGSAINPDRSAVMHYDGHAWTEQLSVTDGSLGTIWGTSPTDLFALGYRAAFHFNGSAWSALTGPMPNASFLAAWGPGPGDIFLGRELDSDTGPTSLVSHSDGATWSELTMPTFANRDSLVPGATRLDGTSDSDVWVFAKQRHCYGCNHKQLVILHYDGLEWTESFSRTGVETGGLAVLSPTDVWVGGMSVDAAEDYVGDGPVLLHYDGVAWSQDASVDLAEHAIKDIWGSSGSDVYALGRQHVLHFDGTRWSALFAGQADRVWGTSAGNVFILRNNEILYRLPV
jgi:hypothetical protein